MAYPVAVIQCAVEPGEIEQNRNTIVRLAAEAISRGAKIVVLPEATVTDIYRGAEKLAETIPGPSTELLARIAGGAVIALPILERSSAGHVFSACAFVDCNGVRGIARKAHLYRDTTGLDSFNDSEVVSAADELTIVDLRDVRVGVLLGFDAEFPEAFRTLALKGADLALVALNTTQPDLPFLAAMARRNRLPLLVANRIGFRRSYPAVPEFSAMALSLVQDRDGSYLLRCKGGSAILEADGTIVAESGSTERSESFAPDPSAPRAMLIPQGHFQDEEILTASFRIDELRVQRLTTPFIAQRRPELYQT